MVLDVEKLEGKPLANAMEKFVVEFCGSCSCTNYAGLMALITIFSGFNLKEKEGTSGFKHARRLLKAWRDYAATDNDTVDVALEGWLDMCKSNQITGSLGGCASTYNSAGFSRMHTPSEEHQFTVDFFLQELTGYIGFEQVDRADAKLAHAEFYINAEMEQVRGVAHGLRQGEDVGYAEWIEQFESRLEDLDKAVEDTEDGEYYLNDSQVMANFKEAMSKTFWLKVSRLLEERSLVWKNLTLDEAKQQCIDAAKLEEIKDANTKVYRSFSGNKSQPAAEKTGLTWKQKKEEREKKAAAEKKSSEEKKIEGYVAPAAAAGEGDSRRKKYPCRFFEAGRCEKGSECPFEHVVKGFVSPVPKAKDSTGVKMMRVIDYEEESGAEEGAAGEIDDCSPIVRDDARWRLRVAHRFKHTIEEGLEELAELEVDRSMRMEEAPADHKRVPKQRSTEGYAMLGSYVDQEAVDSIEGREALLDSSIDGDESMDLESSGSDHEVTMTEKKVMEKRYRTLMDLDARQLLELRVMADNGGDGDLLISTNSDLLQEMEGAVKVVHMRRPVQHSNVFKKQLREKAEKKLKVQMRHSGRGQENTWYSDAAMEALEAGHESVTQAIEQSDGAPTELKPSSEWSPVDIEPPPYPTYCQCQDWCNRELTTAREIENLICDLCDTGGCYSCGGGCDGTNCGLGLISGWVETAAAMSTGEWWTEFADDYRTHLGSNAGEMSVWGKRDRFPGGLRLSDKGGLTEQEQSNVLLVLLRAVIWKVSLDITSRRKERPK
jgi:hypothetical protein